MKELWNEWKVILLCLVILGVGPAQCAYDNYVKWQVVKAAKKVADR